MIDRMSGRVSLIIVSAALVLVLILGWFVLVSPERSKASKLDTQINDTNVQLDAVTSLLNGPVGRESLASLRVSQTAIPDNQKMSQILRQLVAAAATAGVELDGILPQAAVPLSGADALPITMNITGHYFAIQRFLRILRSEAELNADKLRANGRLYTVDSIGFTGGASSTAQTGQSSAGLVTAALTVNAFAYNPTAVAPTPVAPAATTGTTSTTSTTAATTP